MGKHRFIGDLAGNRDHRGQWIGPGDPPLVEPVGAPALCDVCGATPEDPECLCKPDTVSVTETGSFDTGTGTGTDEVPETSETSETVATETGTETGTEDPETVETAPEK